MTLKNSQVEQLFIYLSAEYQQKLQDLESERIKAIKESEEYKNLIEKTKDFLLNINFNKESIDSESLCITNSIFHVDRHTYDTWINRMFIERKLKAILSTLPDSLSFEEIVKLVYEKLNFEQIINKQ